MTELEKQIERLACHIDMLYDERYISGLPTAVFQEEVLRALKVGLEQLKLGDSDEHDSGSSER